MIKNFKLRCSLNELRNKIDVEKDSWKYINSTNSYLYALGIDVPQIEICYKAGIPGSISKNINPLLYQKNMSYETLIRNIYSDCRALNIRIRNIKLNDSISIDEWKIVLFVDFIDSKRLIDFHFLRQKKDGLWYHKPGTLVPSNKDCSDNIIINPKKCDMLGYQYQRCFALRLNK